MKLLFDQNISYRITKLISDKFPEAKHLSKLGLADSTDMAIWEFARSNSYTIVTFDSDYYDLSIVRGCPPKIIWLLIGNASTARTHNGVRSEFFKLYIKSGILEKKYSV